MLLFRQYSFLLGFVEGNIEDSGHWTKAEPLEDTMLLCLKEKNLEGGWKMMMLS